MHCTIPKNRDLRSDLNLCKKVGSTVRSQSQFKNLVRSQSLPKNGIFDPISILFLTYKIVKKIFSTNYYTVFQLCQKIFSKIPWSFGFCTYLWVEINKFFLKSLGYTNIKGLGSKRSRSLPKNGIYDLISIPIIFRDLKWLKWIENDLNRSRLWKDRQSAKHWVNNRVD